MSVDSLVPGSGPNGKSRPPVLVTVGGAAGRAAAHEHELLKPDALRIDPTWALRLPANLALRREMLPIGMSDKKVLVACADPSDHAGLEAVERYLGNPVIARRADHESLLRALHRVYPDPTAPAVRPGSATRGPEADDDAVGLADEILRHAVIRQASDIHIEPRRDGVRIRLRVDGELEELRRLPTSRQTGLISRLKVLSGMDIAERRAPQDGAFRWSLGNGRERPEVDIRVATVPVKYGERMTLRLLNLNAGMFTLHGLAWRRRIWNRLPGD